MIGLIMASAGALLIGLVIGHTWGENSGYAAGVRSASLSPTEMFPIQSLSIEHQRIQARRKMFARACWTPSDLKLASTSAVYSLCESMVRELIAKKILRPAIVEEKTLPDHNIERTIGVSFFVATDPEFDRDYPPLAFFERPLTPD